MKIRIHPIIIFLFVCYWRNSAQWIRASSFTRFLDHTRPSTVGITPLDEWSARRRDLYLSTHTTQNRQTSMPPVGFEPTISAGKRPQTYVLDRAATGTGYNCIYVYIFYPKQSLFPRFSDENFVCIFQLSNTLLLMQSNYMDTGWIHYFKWTGIQGCAPLCFRKLTIITTLPSLKRDRCRRQDGGSLNIKTVLRLSSTLL